MSAGSGVSPAGSAGVTAGAVPSGVPSAVSSADDVLMVVLGTVFLGTGFLVDRARRELVQALETTDTRTDSEGTDR